jgi:carboxylesterase type B
MLRFLKVCALTILEADGFFRPQRLPDATVTKLLDLYPRDPRMGCPYNTGVVKLSPGELDKMACSIFGDLVQIAPARMIASSLTVQGVAAYRYRFNHLPRQSSNVASGIGTGAELGFVFSNGVASHAWDQALAFEVTAAWVSFVHGLDPNWGEGRS